MGDAVPLLLSHRRVWLGVGIKGGSAEATGSGGWDCVFGIAGEWEVGGEGCVMGLLHWVLSAGCWGFVDGLLERAVSSMKSMPFFLGFIFIFSRSQLSPLFPQNESVNISQSTHLAPTSAHHALHTRTKRPRSSCSFSSCLCRAESEVGMFGCVMALVSLFSFQVRTSIDFVGTTTRILRFSYAVQKAICVRAGATAVQNQLKHTAPSRVKYTEQRL